jgi:NAD(P)-dependent dehydrogenase (short-subunit alcohol dehydrogenase family)
VATTRVLQDADPSKYRDHRFGLPERRWGALRGKSFWITGAGTGYGRAIALALLAAGAQVFVTGRRIEKLRETVAEGVTLGIEVERCIPMRADITSESDLSAAMSEIAAHVSHLDGLIHSAALPEPNAGAFPLADIALPAWSQLLTTNITGQWLVSKMALPLLQNGAGFKVVFLSSEAGWASTPGFGPYNVSKAAVNTLGASLAAECAAKFPGQDIQINVLVPGEARTEMNQGSSTSPYAVVSMTLLLLSHPRGGPNGYFFHRDGRHLSFAYSAAFPEDLLGSQ